jgi:large subunit ribosomal protein L4
VGNRRNSAWKGGQKAHGPVLRDYSIGLNCKMRAMGMMVALSAKLREGNLHVFDALSFGSTKTKELNALLIQHGISDPAKSLSSLVIDTDFDDKFLLACRNLALVTPLPQTGANVYDIIKRDKLVVSASAFLALQNLQERILEQFNYQRLSVVNYQGKRRLFLVHKTLLSVDQSEV